ncbi:MAG: STAS domain-containing protein [Aliivibrio sp.]|uniref:STAS domain-containing protein n=1 Tax=Aliivibrio sp. TaxID=1872443 RepID=UPI001A41AE7F|nr:STAS domain-containing protein [Aliivibrio sp.]
MIETHWKIQNSHSCLLQGTVDRESVPDIWNHIQAWKPTEKSVKVDLSKLKRVDSAGLVLFLHLIEHAKKSNCHIMLDSVPDHLLTLIQLSNVELLIADHI